MNARRQQQGLSVIIIVFLLVVIGAIAAIVGKLSATQHFTHAFSQRGAQAYFAARAGMDYALARITANAGCAGIASPLTIEGYSVVIGCAISGSFNEGGASNYAIYDLQVTASAGGFSAPDAVNRRLQATVKYP